MGLGVRRRQPGPPGRERPDRRYSGGMLILRSRQLLGCTHTHTHFLAPTVRSLTPDLQQLYTLRKDLVCEQITHSAPQTQQGRRLLNGSERKLCTTTQALFLIVKLIVPLSLRMAVNML